MSYASRFARPGMPASHTVVRCLITAGTLCNSEAMIAINEKVVTLEFQPVCAEFCKLEQGYEG